MRVRRQPSARLQFAAKILQLLLREPPFEECARIHPRRGMALKIHDIAIAALSPGTQEVITCYFVKRGSRSIGRNVAADAAFNTVGANELGHGVPTNQTLDPPPHFLAAGKGCLVPC